MTGSEYQQLVEFLGRQFTAIDGQFASVYGRFDAIDRRFDALEQRIEERFREVFGHFDEIYRRLERLEQEYQAIVQALRRIEGLLADEVARREMLERGLEELKRHVTVLQARIEELEHRLRG
ncbi:MAG: hypothetical protein HYW16_04750 [Candidatus Rokubacteria bacterium]|nr:hypothetical protein [Candidatus Rokubacteria bacterium]MBI2544516.1 hypothetical protein [Candidatus Rokubacteria bacterium]